MSSPPRPSSRTPLLPPRRPALPTRPSTNTTDISSSSFITAKTSTSTRRGSNASEASDVTITAPPPRAPLVQYPSASTVTTVISAPAGLQSAIQEPEQEVAVEREAPRIRRRRRRIFTRKPGAALLLPVILLAAAALLLFAIFSRYPSPERIGRYRYMETGFEKDNGGLEAEGKYDYQYETVRGFFMQAEPSTNESDFDYIARNFGLMKHFHPPTDQVDEPEVELAGAPKWKEFKDEIARLNSQAAKGTSYKVLFLARHGQGYHNVAEEFYGTHLWDCYWSLLDGNGTIRWDDAHLTDQGIAEAKTANSAWKTQLSHGAPLPEAWFASPMHRAAMTCQLTWEDISLQDSKYPKPIIIENLRETLGVHTCDRRSTKCEIAANFPTFTLADSVLPGPDPLWDPVNRESNSHRTHRLKLALDEIMQSKLGQRSTYISLTAHSGAIVSILEAVGHREFKLATGGVLPVVVKVTASEHKASGQSEELDEQRNSEVNGTAPRCTVDPTPAPTA